MNIELQVKNLFANASQLDEAGFVADFYYIAKEYARQQNGTKPLVSSSLPAFTANDIDGAYFLGVFNTGGIDGLSHELKTIKELGFMPHQLMHMLKVGGKDH